jgi:PAS domain S-box-containing protein
MIFKSTKRTSKVAILAGGLCVLGLATGGFYLSWSGLRAARGSAASVEHTQKILSLTDHVLGLLKDTETGGRGYTLTGQEDFLEPYRQSGAVLNAALVELRALEADNPVQSADVSRLRAAATDERKFMTEQIRVRRERGFAAAQAIVLTRGGKRRMDLVRSIAALLEKNERNSLRLRVEEETAAAGWASTMTFLGGGLSLFFLAGAVFLLVREMDFEEEASRSALLLQTILTNLGDGVVVADKNGKFLLWNPAAERIIGVGHTDAETPDWSKTYGTFLTDQKTPYASSELPLVKAIRGEACDNVELFVRNVGAPDGRWLNLSGRPLRDESSKLFGGVVLIHDISEQKNALRRLEELNESLRRQGEELRAANKELESFSYSVSHDLRAPLRGIAGFTQILLEDCAGSLDESGKEYLNRVVTSTKLMETLIEDILELSRVSRTDMKRKKIDMSKLAAKILEELQEKDPRRKVDARVPDGLVADGDPNLVRIALVNLIGNAWKYTGKAAKARIEFGAAPGARGETVFFVKDNGAGFDMAYSEKTLRRLSTPASPGGIRRDGDRLGDRAAHHPKARREDLGGKRRRARRGFLFRTVAGDSNGI